MPSDPTKFLTTKYGALELTSAILKSVNKHTLASLPKLLHPSPQTNHYVKHFEAVIMMTV